MNFPVARITTFAFTFRSRRWLLILTEVSWSSLETEFDEVNEDEGGLKSPMPGRIVKIFVKQGQKVKKGQDLISIEAMKMENRITAPYDGIITKIYFSVGEQVEANTPLIELENIESKKSNEE